MAAMTPGTTAAAPLVGLYGVTLALAVAFVALAEVECVDKTEDTEEAATEALDSTELALATTADAELLAAPVAVAATAEAEEMAAEAL